jgi:hypothetical protein
MLPGCDHSRFPGRVVIRRDRCFRHGNEPDGSVAHVSDAGMSATGTGYERERHGA